MVGYIQEPVRNDKVSVGLSNTLIAEPRNDIAPRKAILIRNTSPNATDIITINLGMSTAQDGFGIVLQKGESFSDSTESGYECFQGTINAICETANGQLSIMER